MDLEKRLSNLTLFYNKEEYILLTAAQTQKDLSQFNLDFILNTDEISFEALMNTLKPIIQDLLQNNREKIVQLFYRIDVPENKIGEAFDLGNYEDTTRSICQIILHRELKKVIIRKHYSSLWNLLTWIGWLVISPKAFKRLDFYTKTERKTGFKSCLSN